MYLTKFSNMENDSKNTKVYADCSKTPHCPAVTFSDGVSSSHAVAKIKV